MPKMSRFLLSPQGLRAPVEDETDETPETPAQEDKEYQGLEAANKPPKKQPGTPTIGQMVGGMKRKKQPRNV